MSSCENFDLKAWVLGEVDRRDKSRYEEHLAHCEPCGVELGRLQAMRSALLTLPEEELPRRIAFVSDRVFEPKWWQTIWHSGPAIGFASSAMLAGAILVHGFVGPAPVPVAQAPVATVQTLTVADVDKRVQIAVAKAVAEVEARERTEHQQILAAADRKIGAQGQALIASEETNRLLQNQLGRMMVAANRGPQ
jgi:anti-sigma factor RsiW